MANVLDGLLGRIADDALRVEIAAEVARLRSSKEFGLVFERHLPETVALHTHPVARGTRVRLKSNPDRGLFRVLRVSGDTAQVVGNDGARDEFPVSDLVVVRIFGETIYPGFRSVGRVERGEDKPFHAVINGENHHVLEGLAFALEGRVDCVYIDPPYNTGARDWKYNNNYVDGNDTYRHSKWLSFMERRLLLARRLLKPDSVLVVTIDANEVHHLGLLLEQLFPSARRQMVTIVMNPSGASGAGGGLSRVEEYAFFCFFGTRQPNVLPDDLLTDPKADGGKRGKRGVRWEWLMRGGNAWYRAKRPNLCYPVILTRDGSRILRAGEPLSVPEGADEIAAEEARPRTIDDHPAIWPVRKDGRLGIWRVDGQKLNALVEKGYAYTSGTSPGSVRYLLKGTIDEIASGEVRVIGRGSFGEVLVETDRQNLKVPKTVWSRSEHIAGGAGGTQLVASLVGERGAFPFPKSLYAVEDTLDIAVGDLPDALVVDFFAGSGTTAHAVMRLNRRDSGSRTSVLVTNNEVAEEEARALLRQGFNPGDRAWEDMGIFHRATMPRVMAAVTGETRAGAPVEGDYNYRDDGPIADGFEENVEFLTFEYLDRNNVARGAAFEAIAPLLWLRAGASGLMIEQIQRPFAVPTDARYGVLFDIHAWQPFVEAVEARNDLAHVFIVTDSLAQYQQVVAELPPSLEASMLYEDYLRNFEFVLGGAR